MAYIAADDASHREIEASKSDSLRLMGFGHRVYKNIDPPPRQIYRGPTKRDYQPFEERMG
jgi:citrate synthase